MNDNYKIALEQALSWISTNYTAKAIIVSGSIIRGNPDKNSDFDIYVIHDKKFRQRVQKLFNNVACEIFINNIEQIYNYYEIELKNNRPVTANIIATGVLYLGNNDKEILTLVEKAKIYAGQSKQIKNEELTFNKYRISNLFEDATDIASTDKLSALFILDKVVLEIIDFVFILRQKPLPRIKDRLKILNELDSTIGELIYQYYQNTSFEKRYELTNKILRLTIGEIGFFEWTSTPE